MQENVKQTVRPSLEELEDLHDFVKQTVVSHHNDLQTFKCSRCGLVIKKGAGWYQALGDPSNQRLATCKNKNPLIELDKAKKLYKVKTPQVIFVETTKFSMIALDYKEPLYSKLSPQQQQELVSGPRRQVSNKPYGQKPFNDRIIAVTFRDHFIKDSFRIFKGNAEECFAFLDFYMTESPAFQPVEFVYTTKFGSTLKFTDINQFKNAVRK